MKNYMNIRIETSSDYAAVERLTFAAFETMNLPGRTHTSEHFLVSLLRSDPWFIPELDFVAEVSGEIVGSIFYSHSKIVRPEGGETGTITFGPVSVAPKLHGRGIGSALIRHSLERARQMYLRAVLIMGHPGYYPRFGFTGAANFGITLADGAGHDAFMALELVPGTLTAAGGRWQCAKAFDICENNTEAFEAYHRRFLSNFP
ncbi:N-acetyltransferase [Spirochaetia bacterium]|nr:N-acetyltransferase [Spirochaetia bacterium]